jgi:membrane-associated phospholipid phosphatase
MAALATRGRGYCVYFILTVGLSRVLERGHWPSDVLAGYLVGMLSLYHVLALRRQTARGTKPEPRASQRS